MDRLSLGGLLAAALIAFSFSAKAQVIPSYPTLNDSKIYPAIVCATKESVLDIATWSDQHYRKEITLDQLKTKMEKYSPICDSGWQRLVLTKEIRQYTGFSRDMKALQFGVFETQATGLFAIIAIGEPVEVDA